MNLLKKLAMFFFGVAVEPQKEKIKQKLDKDTERTSSDFVKKRNEIEKLLLDMVDEKAVGDVMNIVDKKLKKNKK